MTGVVNEHRGEFEIELEGTTYGMRPSYEAIVAFEKGTGKGLLVLASDAQAQTLGVGEAAIIVTECCKAWGTAVGDKAAPHFNARRVGELLVEHGFLMVLINLKLMLWVAATGGVTSAGEMKAMPTTTETTEPTPASASKASPQPRSGGRGKGSGKPPR